MNLLKYVQKPTVGRILPRLVEECSTCGKERRFNLLEKYLDGKISCKECRSKLRLLTIPLQIATDRIASGFNITHDDLKMALRTNIIVQRAIFSYLEGIGRFGVQIPQPPGAPLFVIVSVTQRCNLRCKFCYNEEYIGESGPQEMDNKLVRLVIDQMSDAGCLGIGFNGGEPTLRADLCELVSYAASRDLIPLLGTNGILIDKDYAHRLKESGLLYAQVSLDGTRSTHDSIRGSEGSYDKAVEAIKNLVNEGIYVSVAMLVTKKNIKELSHIFEVARSCGAAKFEIIDFHSLGRGKKDEEFELTARERDNVSEEMCLLWRNVIKNGDKISLLYKNPAFVRSMTKIFPKIESEPYLGAASPMEARTRFSYARRLKEGIFSVQDPFSPIATCCEVGFFGFYVDVDGTMTPCPYMPLPLDNVMNKTIHEVWHSSKVLNEIRNRTNLNGECKGCDYKELCAGCRARAYNLTGDYLSSDPMCSKINVDANQ